MFCEKCGFEYEGEKCPVCEAEVAAVENVEVEAVAKKSVLPIIALIAGIASIVLALIGGFLVGVLGGILFTILLILPAVVPGAAAVVLGILGMKSNKKLGIVAIILGAVSIAAYLVAGVVGYIISFALGFILAGMLSVLTA